LAGERAYHMARRGATFTLAPRRVRVHAIEVLAYAYPLLRLRVVTGPGVYVRSLARDLGEALGSAAYLRELQRESIGPFSVQDAVDVTAVPPSDVVARLLPAECAVAHLPALEVDAEAAEALVQGRRVPGPATALVVAGPLRMIGPGGFLGVGVSVRGELRSLKVLHPERCRP
jgi:tRNA pseudouridine55 synthase